MFTPGVGVCDLNLSGAFTPGVGVCGLNLSELTASDDRTLTVAASMGGLASAIHLALDTGLLNSIGHGTSGSWRDGEPATTARVHRYQDAHSRTVHERAGWNEGAVAAGNAGTTWRDAQRLTAKAIAGFRDATLQSGARSATWRDARFIAPARVAGFRDAARLSGAVAARWQDGAPIQLQRVATFQDALPVTRVVIQRVADAVRLTPITIASWRQAGYPAHAKRVIPPIIVPGRGVFWDATLDVRCPLLSFPVHLNLQETQCNGALAYIPIQRSYIVLNSAVLVRLPDRTELPCIALAIETDSESWCWSLSATLKSDPAWPLLQPVSEQPWEVEATLNGRVFQFVVDEVTSDRAFGNHTVTLRARSRSAWLDDPYQPSITVTAADATTAQQVAENALDGTGWALVWPVDDALAAIDWLIPAGVYSRDGTIIGRVGTIAKTVGWGLYTDPTADTLTAYPQYPLASWLWGALSPVIAIPEDVTPTIQRQPVFAVPYNGLYLAGTTAGKLVFAKIAGTDGLLQPQAPIVDSLFCDESGVAARQRAIYELSKSGFSETVTATMPYLPALGVLRPGQFVQVGAVRGMIRKVSIAAVWERGLKITQTLGLEVRP